MPFGKYKGQFIDEIEDTSYLSWAEGIAQPWLKEVLQAELEYRANGGGDDEEEAPPGGLTPEQLQVLVSKGRRMLAQRYHPDRHAGGNVTGGADIMTGINLMADWLLAQLQAQPTAGRNGGP